MSVKMPSSERLKLLGDVAEKLGVSLDRNLSPQAQREALQTTADNAKRVLEEAERMMLLVKLADALDIWEEL